MPQPAPHARAPAEDFPEGTKPSPLDSHSRVRTCQTEREYTTLSFRFLPFSGCRTLCLSVVADLAVIAAAGLTGTTFSYRSWRRSSKRNQSVREGAASPPSRGCSCSRSVMDVEANRQSSLPGCSRGHLHASHCAPAMYLCPIPTAPTAAN